MGAVGTASKRYVEGEFDESHFDVIVIGSGFGGSVAAYELANRGMSVCLLERGKAHPPGSFPRTPSDFASCMWDPRSGSHGMFNIWSFKGIEAVTASGLGGGSLIYANVLLRKDDSWFVQHHPYRTGETETWPIGYDDLEPHYSAIEEFMRVETVPDEAALPKVMALQQAAEALGKADDFHLAPLAVRFTGENGSFNPGQAFVAETYPNIHGPVGDIRRTCLLCGECDIGCNSGAKNTLDHTYVSAAAAQGAVVSTRSEVVGLRRVHGGGFEVDYVVHSSEREGKPTDTRWLTRRTLTASRVVLGAGTLGSTYLLLRHRAELGLATPALGTRFCGNGDMLGFVFRAQVDGLPRALEGSRGPVIGSYLRWPDSVDGDPADAKSAGEHGMYLEDAGYPSFLQWLVESTQLGATAGRAARLAAGMARARTNRKRDTVISDDLRKFIGDGALSRTSLPLLAMGLDVPDGRLHLQDESSTWMESTWTLDTSQAYFETVTARMKAVSDALQGRTLINPQYLLRRVVTVHALGGAPMGTDPDQSVVDGYGQVHGVPGLYVCDGSVMPGPVGANPSLTIAAFARRMAHQMPETAEAAA